MRDKRRVPSPTEQPLAGLSVVVTRPAHQAEPLCQRIEAAGGCAIRMPLLEICAPENTDRLDHLIDRLQEFDTGIFISANAVQFALRHVRERGANLGGLKLAAIGHKTAEILAALGHPVDICPREGFRSEDLLALNEMRVVREQRIIIFRGEGGRELLAETLRARGATVEYAEVYRRVKACIDRDILERHFAGRAVDLITVTSGEALRNLSELCGPRLRNRLHQIPLLVGSQRMLEQAREIGFTSAATVRNPSDDTMFDGVLRWAGQRRATGDIG